MKTPPVITIQPPPPPSQASSSTNYSNAHTNKSQASAGPTSTTSQDDIHNNDGSNQHRGVDFNLNCLHAKESPSEGEPDELAHRWDPSQNHVQMLRAKFIGLVNYKKFRLIYLLSLSYMMLNLLLSLWLLIKNGTSQVINWNDQKWMLNDTIREPILPCNFFNISPMVQSQDISSNTDLILVCLVTVILIIVQTPLMLLVQRSYFSRVHQETASFDGDIEATRFSNSLATLIGQPWAHKLALSISLIIFHFQILSVTISSLMRSQDEDYQRENNYNKQNWSHHFLIATSRPRLGSSLILAYITPMMLDPGSTLLNILGVSLLIPSTCFALASYFGYPDYSYAGPEIAHDMESQQQQSSSYFMGLAGEQLEYQLLLLIILNPVMLMFGWLQRISGRKSICEQIFMDANKLIEAKVSLEAQRQQQETLLLSVLPAYVAEQVKRNMLRQVEQSQSPAQTQPQLHYANITNYNTSLSSNHNNATVSSNLPVVVANSAAAITGFVGQLHSMQSVVSVRESSSRVPGQPVTELAASSNLQSLSSAASVASKNKPIICADKNDNNNQEAIAKCYRSCRKSSFPEGASDGSIKRAAKAMNQASSPRARVARSSSIHASPQAAIAFASTNKLQAKSTNYLGLSSSSNINPASISPSHNQNSMPPSSPARRGFNELFIRTYNNVSLLYADIVGFTQLCTKLSASHLVKVLNNLFSQFDHLAEQHKIMRIKILGDCYYGVSGIPEFAVLGAKSRLAHKSENHAINCVNMGLDMIDYIACLNRELASNRSEKLMEVLQGKADTSSTTTPCSFDQNAPPPQAMEKIELNMRIGIHSGHIHSGVIGLKKWQFDVWSNDVSIAMHCESSGTPGRVQVTEATIGHLKGAFIVEANNAGYVDPFLDGQHIKTYFIIERNNNLINNNINKDIGSTNSALVDGNEQARRPCHSRLMEPGGACKNRSLVSPSARTHLRDNDLDKKIRAATINTIHQTLLSVDCFTSDTSDIINNQKPRLNYHNLTSFRLNFKDPNMRRLYSNRSINGLPCELITLWLVLAIVVPATNWLLDVKILLNFITDNPMSQSICTSLLLFLVNITHLLKLPPCFNTATSSTPSSHNYRLTTTQAHNKPTKNSFGSILQGLVSNGDGSFGSNRKNNHNNQQKPTISGLQQKLTAGLILFLMILEFGQILWFHDCKLARDANPLVKSFRLQQIQVSTLLFLVAINCSTSLLGYSCHSALLLMLVLVSLHSIPIRNNFFGFWASCEQACYVESLDSLLLLDWFSGFLLIIALAWSFLWARQVEFANKANFLWRNQLSVDHEELEYISGINKILLENILPSHVVQYYLNQQQQQNQTSPTVMMHPRQIRRDTRDQQPHFKFALDRAEPFRMSFTSLRSFANHHELYHESHQGVAVMFASIPHFYEFYDETDVSKQGLGCIALLNEIICDFDKLLLKNKFSRIEKIKTIGSTYMAVAGLRPQHWNGSARVSNASQSTMGASDCSSMIDGFVDNGDSLGKFLMSQQKQNLLCMVQFATNLMQALNNINKQSFQAFKLRVGLNSGSVIAGVIGAQRPFYDIWGDTVNIASRMETLGHVGRIQVTELAANILLDTTGVENAYRIVKRGKIQVKGKGGMVTYFVDKRDKLANS